MSYSNYKKSELNYSGSLDLFSLLIEEKFREGADRLIEALNAGSKQRDHYKIHYYYKHDDKYVLIACNRDKDLICNVVDENGEIPNGFDVCWRLHQFVLEELNIKLVK